jgi:two-component system, NarL family, response regulator DevR
MKSVARRMGISPETVKDYLMRVRRRYGEVGRPAATKTELYFRAVEDGLVPPPISPS